MDNSVVVAITSIATVILTGSITLLSKLIDAFQKKNEQAMVISASYINKRIQAAEAAVGKNNFSIHALNSMIRYYENFVFTKNINDDLLKNVSFFEEKEKAIAVDTLDFADLYFDIEPVTNEYELHFNSLNSGLDLILKINHQYSEPAELTEQEIDSIINELDNIMNNLVVSLKGMKDSRVKLNTLLRNELRSYSIVH